jgi:hypothetical protein
MKMRPFRATAVAALLAAAVVVAGSDDPALLDAVQKSDLVRVRALVRDRAGLRVRDRDGATALHFAAAYGRADIVTVLLDAGADLLARDVKGETPLHAAARSSRGDTPSVLLAHGASVDLWDEDGNTPLHAAAQNGNLMGAALICAYGASLEERNEEGRTPLEEARAELARSKSPEREATVALLQPGGACAVLSARRIHGESVTAEEAEDAALPAGCDAGVGRYCTNLGLRYEDKATPEDLTRAAALFERGCKADSARGCAYFGNALEHGRGVPTDLTRAVQLYEQACTAKDPWGCGYLGRAYAGGRGVARDPALATPLLEQACKGGVDWSCRRLAAKP